MGKASMVTGVKETVGAVISIALLYLTTLLAFLIMLLGAFVVLPWEGAKALWRRLHSA